MIILPLARFIQFLREGLTTEYTHLPRAQVPGEKTFKKSL